MSLNLDKCIDLKKAFGQTSHSLGCQHINTHKQVIIDSPWHYWSYKVSLSTTNPSHGKVISMKNTQEKLLHVCFLLHLFLFLWTYLFGLCLVFTDRHWLKLCCRQVARYSWLYVRGEGISHTNDSGGLKKNSVSQSTNRSPYPNISLLSDAWIRNIKACMNWFLGHLVAAQQAVNGRQQLAMFLATQEM